MTQTHVVNGKKYLSARSAAQLVGYSSDYVTRLAREEKVSAEQVGRQWFVDPESLKYFSLTAEAEKRERSEKIREDRLTERAQILFQAHEAALLSHVSTSKYTTIAQTAILSACLFLFVNIFWFSLESKLNTHALSGGLSAIGSQLTSKIVTPIPDFLSQVASFAFVVQQSDSVSESSGFDNQARNAENSNEPDFQGIVLFEETEISVDEIEKVRESFSDEVDVAFDSEDTGVITPVFKERTGDSYRFLLVPVKPPGN